MSKGVKILVDTKDLDWMIDLAEGLMNREPSVDDLDGRGIIAQIRADIKVAEAVAERQR